MAGMEAVQSQHFSFARLFFTVFIIALSLAMVVPFLWMISTSLKSDSQVLVYPPAWIPDPVSWANYPAVLKLVPFWRFLLGNLTGLGIGTSLLLIFAKRVLRAAEEPSALNIGLCCAAGASMITLCFLVARSFARPRRRETSALRV